ncbi:MAG: ABC transporter permease [Acidimicrobiales bacterium]
MTAVTAPTAPPAATIRAREPGFVADLLSVAGRAVRSIPREPAELIPALMVPLFFFVVNVGALQDFSEQGIANFDYKAFQLPVAIIFAVTGVSRASTLVTDIQDGYFDRLLLTPVRRSALLLGLMAADFALVCALCVPVVALGLLLGVTFETGVIGIVAFIVMAGLWGLVFTGFPYAIALKTGSPGAVASSFILFFPFAFLTTSTLPRGALTGWLSTVAGYNPVTYLLDGMRALVSEGWEWAPIGKGLLAIALVGLASQSMCFAALRGRVKRG